MYSNGLIQPLGLFWGKEFSGLQISLYPEFFISSKLALREDVTLDPSKFIFRSIPTC